MINIRSAVSELLKRKLGYIEPLFYSVSRNQLMEESCNKAIANMRTPLYYNRQQTRYYPQH